jgi:hypothetical protein
MKVVPGPGLCPDPGLGLAEKGLQAFQRRLAAEVAGYEILDASSYDGIDGGFPLKCEPAGLLKEFFVDFECNIGHFASPAGELKQKLAQVLCHVKSAGKGILYPGFRGHGHPIAAESTGFNDFVETVLVRGSDKREETLAWAGGRYDPIKVDPKKDVNWHRG